MKKRILFIGFLLLSKLIIAQEQPILLNEVVGLGYGYNDFVKQDNYGYIWISSLNGVYKFNGTNWKHYKLNLDGVLTPIHRTT